MSITDALSRINQIQVQITSLTQGVAPSRAAATGGVSASAPAGLDPSGTGASFATTLAQAQGSSAAAAIGSPDAAGAAGATPYGAALDVSGVSALGSGLGAGASVGGAALSPAAQRMLTSAQGSFAARLSADTGLSPQVVSAWVLAEESGQAAVSRQSQGNNDWLNIGYTDSGTYGSADSVWSDPVSAADATAGWLKGRNTIPGYGTASSGVQAILATVGQPPQAQVAAIQSSGWASSGYPDLPGLLGQLSA